MFGISMWELGLIILVALILLGPRQLTETARVLGRLYREVTKMTNDLRGSIDFDSMTSTTSSSPRFDPRPSHDEPAPSSRNDMDMLVTPGERSGPDFYAELLESSKEEDSKEECSKEGGEEKTPQQSGDHAEKQEPKKADSGSEKAGEKS